MQCYQLVKYWRFAAEVLKYGTRGLIVMVGSSYDSEGVGLISNVIVYEPNGTGGTYYLALAVGD